MLDHLTELLHLIVRWTHLIAGIMWIGNSLLFNWLDRNLVKPKGAKPELVGEIWMVHSGGFYQVEKKALKPAEMPKVLHWFKWQNGITWLSGISLLILVYYMGASSTMVDPRVSDITPSGAVLLSLISLPLAFLAYDLMWRSAIGKMPTVAFLLSVAVVVVSAAVFFTFLSGRAAYIHVGVLLGTLMTGNVWFVIMPSQRELIAATLEGREQDPAIGYQAKQRSVHNNYMTFPLLFIMLSGHFPSTFEHPHNWLVLLFLSIGSAGIRWCMNMRYSDPDRWLFPLGLAFFGPAALVLGLLANPGLLTANAPARTTPVAFVEVADIMQKRCTTCHSASPSHPVYRIAPNGVTFDTADQIIRRGDDIYTRAVKLRNMPLANETHITEEERETLRAWVDQGKKGPDEAPAPAPSTSASAGSSAAPNDAAPSTQPSAPEETP